jgi:hypothetical protein
MKLRVTLNTGSLVLAFALISQFIPAYFSYQFDFSIILILLFVALYNINSIKKNANIFLIVVVYIFLVFCIVMYRELYFYDYGSSLEKSYLSDLRPILLLLFASLFIESFSLKVSRKQIYYLSLFLIIILSVPNFFGMFDIAIYQKIHSILYSDVYYVGSYLEQIGKHMTVSSYASLNSRLSSIFLQPAVAGIFFASMTFFFILQAKFYENKIPIYFLIFLSLYNGYLSSSSVIDVLPAFLLFSIFNFSYRMILMLFFIFIGTLLCLYLFVNEYFLILDRIFLGSRFHPDENIVKAWSVINISMNEFFVGINKIASQAIGKGFGDSGYLIKYTNGGALYVILYYSTLLILIRKVFVKFARRIEYFQVRSMSKYFNSLLLMFLTAEIGFTPFSQPQSSLMITIYLLYLYYFLITTFSSQANKNE